MSILIKQTDGLSSEAEDWLKEYAKTLNEELKIKSKSKARAVAYIIQKEYERSNK